MSGRVAWEVRPLSSVGPVNLGSDEATALRLLEAEPGWRATQRSAPPARRHSVKYQSGLFVQIELDDSEAVEAIEVWYPHHGGPQLTLHHLPLFGLTAKEARAQLPREGSPIVEDGNGFIMRGYELGLTVEDGRIAAVLIGVRGYYDFLDDG